MAKKRDGYYRSEARHSRHKEPTIGMGGLVVRVMDVLLFVLTILSALALLAGLLAKVVNPRATTLFVLPGLFFQIVYLFNVGCALWWAVRWKKWFFISLAVLLLGGGSMGLFYRSDLATKIPEVNRERGDVVVATFNAKAFGVMENKQGLEAEMDSLTQWINSKGAHIVCLQESHFSEKCTFGDFKDGLSRLGYGFFVNSTTSRADSQTGAGFAILSTYPIVRHGISDADSTHIHAVWADVKVGRDTLRVFNTHLQSTGITKEDSNTTLSTNIIDDEKGGDKLVEIVRKMNRNYRLRAAEASHISDQIDGSKYPVVVCGDFNDTPMSYTYRKMRAGRLDDAFVECGRGVEYTYKGLYNIFRIDYILPDEEFFTVKSYDSYDLSTSDHKALIVRLGRDEM